MAGKPVTIRAESTWHIKQLRVTQCLLQTMANSVVVIFCFDDGNGYALLFLQDVIGEFLFLLVPGR